MIARRAVPVFNGSHDRRFVVRRKDELVSHPDCARLDAPGDDAAIIEAIDVLHGKPQRKSAEEADCSKWSSASRIVGPRIPGVFALRCLHIVAVARGDRNE